MKDNIFKNIAKNSFNNSLEEVLSKKNFSEDIKNTLLSIFYKLDNGYDDYKTVKRNTYEKKEYMQKLVKIIDKNCENIIFLKNKEKDQETINKKDKEIKCYPLETNILYSIAKIQKKSVVVNFLDKDFEKAISFVLNIGNNINIVEPLRDFNGFSWNISAKEIEDINCNLIYQNIIFLIGNTITDNWANNSNTLVDYFDYFQNEIEKKYGENSKEIIIKDIIKLALLINSKYDEEFKNNIIEESKKLEQQYFEMQDVTKYLTTISKIKKQKEKEIKKIDKLLNDKELIVQEYEKRNKKLPLEKKIFSVRLFKNNLKEDRKRLLLELDELNNTMKPTEFTKKRETIKYKYELVYCINDISTNNIYETLIHLQKDIINCFDKKINEAQTKQELLELIYQYRYYNYIPIKLKKSIKDEQKLSKYLEKIGKHLLKKSIEMKMILPIYDDNDYNYEITNKILLSKIISLEDINIKINSDTESAKLTVFDENVEDFETNVKNEGLKMRANKKVKFINL